MPFSRPTRTDLIRQAQTDIIQALGLRAILRYSPEDAAGKAVAGLTDGLYGYLDWIARQSVPYDATDEYLEAWARLVEVQRKDATVASGTAQFLGTPGALLPAETAVNRLDGAATYVTTADATVAGGGTVVASITATATGPAGNAAAGTGLVLAGAVAGITSAGVAYVALAGGADREEDDSLRTRMLLRWASPPQGGDAADYLQWALAVPGVTRAWVNPLGMGAGTVVVYTMWDTAEASHQGFPQGTNGVAAAETRDTPATGDQLVVANAIYPLRPVTALVYSVAPIAYAVNFTIHPKTAVPSAVQALVLAAIDAVFIALADPLGSELETSAFEVAIDAVPGMPDFTLTSPSAPITPALGYLPVRGTVTYA